MLGPDWTGPPSPIEIVVPRLHGLIDPDSHAPQPRLMLVSAPPGYGKTALARQRARAWSAQGFLVVVAVISSEDREPDDPPSTFLQLDGGTAITLATERLIAAIRTGDDGDRHDPLQAELFTAISDHAGPCFIVIDGLDYLPTPAGERLVGALLLETTSPPNLSVIATTRTPLRYPLSELATLGLLRQVFSRDLALRADEAARLLAARGVPDPGKERLEAIVEATGGWPVAIALAGHLIGSSGDPGEWAPFDDYVARTLLGSMPPPVRQLVRVTSEFPWISDALWEAMTAIIPGEAPSFESLRTIMPMIPVTTTDPNQPRFTLVPLLRSRLRLGPEEMPALRTPAIAAAIAYLVDQSRVQDAVLLARETDSWDLVLPALIRHCRDLAIRDNHASLIELLSPLPDAVLLGDNDLAFWYGLSVISVGDISEITRLEPRLNERWSESHDPLVQGRLAIVRAISAIWRDERPFALQEAKRALSVLPPSAYHERMRAGATADDLSTYLGLLQDADRMLAIAREAREHLPWDQRWWAIFVLPNQADRFASSGHLSASAKVFQHLIDSSSTAVPEHVGLFLTRLALIDLERNDLISAQARLDAIDHDPPTSYWNQELMLTRAKVLHATGQDDRAREILYASIREADAHHDDLHGRRARAVLAQIWLDTGELDLAELWGKGETLAMDIWPRSYAQTIPGTVMAHLRIALSQWDEAHHLLDHLIAEGERRRQSAPLIRVHALKALAYARGGQVDACHESIRRAIALGDREGFHRSYLVGALDTRTLLATPDHTLEIAATFASPINTIQSVALSAREQDVLRLVAIGLTNAQIAERLFLSPVTVKNHLARIYQRLAVQNRQDAAIAARIRGII